MATVVHGACSSSPRQQHQCELASGVTSGCLTAGHHSHPHQHLHQHQHSHQQTTTPIYSSISKYMRPNTAPQLSGHPHIYDGTSSNSNIGPGQLQFGTPLNQISYIPMGSTVVSHTSPPSLGEPCRNYWSHAHPATLTYGAGSSGGNGRHSTSKRKSAVQLLAETKPFFMKGDAGILDRLQSTVSPAPSYRKTTSFMASNNTSTGSGLKRGRSNATPTVRDQVKYNSSYIGGPVAVHSGGEVERRFLPRPPISRDGTLPSHSAHTHHHQHHNHHSQFGRHSATGYNGNMLQGKLKMLLTTAESTAATRERLHAVDLPRKYDFGAHASMDNCSIEPSLSYMHKDDVVAIPPPIFLSSQSFEDPYSYAGGETSSIDEPLVLTDDYRPISPPAEYAAETTPVNVETRARYNYQRSYSHSHEMTGEHAKYDANAYNINSHKSLPDLHSQISRHSPHSEILSCCSRGNRSIKSAGESSLNRDSGGSSGHYTHRSEPCYRQREAERDIYDSNKAVCCTHVGTVEFRRDSGSSTQHSANSYCGYGSPTAYAECVACRCNSRSLAAYDSACDYLLNFPTPVVPEAFQDDYTPPSPQLQSQPPPVQTQPRIKLSEPPRYYSSSSIEHRQQQQQLYAQTQVRTTNIRLPPHNPQTAHSPGSTPSIEDISPPPIQFKRQKCIRLKNRNRLPLPCNSSGSLMNGVNGGNTVAYSRNEPQTFLFPKCISTNNSNADTDYNRIKMYNGTSSGNNSRRPSCEKLPSTPTPIVMLPLSELEQSPYHQHYVCETDTVSDLEHFFDRLGLNDEKYHEIYAARRHSTATDSDDSSTVFFSDVSTVDSMRLPDSTETQPQTTQPQTTPPPSIVERNARIIKWLCNIRKLEHN